MYLRKKLLSCVLSVKPSANLELKRFLHSKNTVPSAQFRYKSLLLGSAAIAGITVYLSHKNKVNCDVGLDEKESKPILNERIPPNESLLPKNYTNAIKKSKNILRCIKEEKGIPGLVIGVSVDGENIWQEGFGFADVENHVRCTPDTVMRIASISKSITMAAVAKLWEEGKLDLDKPVQEYVPTFPKKTYNGKNVTITCRQLVSHLGGIRHYDKDKSLKVNGNITNGKDQKKANEVKKPDEFSNEEYYSRSKYENVKDALELFQNDPLVEQPGTKYHYTTHGWTLVSAIVEAAAKEKFTMYITKMFKTLGLNKTYLDENDILIYHRAKNYLKNSKGNLINAPFVDNSYKWAGGGFLSTVGDLLHFANAMLYSMQYRPQKDANNNLSAESSVKKLPGFLNFKTMKALWTPALPNPPLYGMGWGVNLDNKICEFCEDKKFSVYHTGGAVGASSVLFILPKDIDQNTVTKLPKGTVVTIICNMHNTVLLKTAKEIAELFHESQ